MDRLGLAVAAAGADHEVVGVADDPAQVELDDLERLAVGRVAGDGLGDLFGGHAYSPCGARCSARRRRGRGSGSARRRARGGGSSVEEIPIGGIWKNSRPLAAPEAGQRPIDSGAGGPTALRHRERGQREHPFRLTPQRQAGRDVAADDQEQLAIGLGRVQFLKGIDRERRPGPGRSPEPTPRSARRPPPPGRHSSSRCSGPGSSSTGLCGRYPGGDQHHAVESELKVRLLGADQVTKMWRIEGAAEDPDSHDAPTCSPRSRCSARTQERTWPAPSTRYLNVHSSRRPIGPRACSFWVELPISAPIPNSPPSVKRVEALT